jgi:hypothetical protein
MKILREYIRELLVEAPVTKSEIEDAIQNASFNSSNSSSHRWSPGQPYIDYYFDDASGNWMFQAAIPDGTNNVANWPRFPEDGWSSDSVETFLSSVKEAPHQLNLPLPPAV